VNAPTPRKRRTSGAPRLTDVAEAAGVSHQTVSRVLNGSTLVRDETRQKVLEATASLGYRRNSAARALVTNKSGRLGVVVAHLEERGPATLAAKLQEAARDEGYEAVFVGLQTLDTSTLPGAIDRLLDQAVEAIVVGVTHRESLEMVSGLQLRIPVVFVEGVADAGPLAAGVGHRAAAAMATDHLLDHGHTSVAHVSGPLEWLEAAERRAGWLSAHEQRGRVAGPEVAGDWTPESGYAAGVVLARDPSVTAVFAANDQMSLGLLRAMHEAGRRVPEDVSVVGYDNLPEAAYFIPPLTTVDQDFGELALRAVKLAVQAISGEKAPAYDLIQATLVERASCAGPPADQVGENVHSIVEL
jgi:DNA-binding LacI/PurR family transcriptional regulator